MTKTRIGFSLAEVIVSTAVMAIMMGSLLAYVHSAAKVYQRTDQNLTFLGEANAVFDGIRNLTESALSMTPSFGAAPVDTPTFTILVATGTPEAGSVYIGTVTVKLMFVTGPPPCLVSTYTACSPSGTGSITWVITESGVNTVSLNRYVATFSQHVASFSASRLSSGTMEVYLRLESATLGEPYSSTYATPSYEATGSFYAPLIR